MTCYVVGRSLSRPKPEPAQNTIINGTSLMAMPTQYERYLLDSTINGAALVSLDYQPTQPSNVSMYVHTYSAEKRRIGGETWKTGDMRQAGDGK